MSVNSKMTAIANKIRTLLGITGAMGLDAMASNISKAQEEVDDQAILIEQLRATLESKAGGIIPAGTITLSENGIHDVAEYASAQVNVPTGITPSGTKTITTNGTHDVTNYASAKVSVNSLPTGITKLATGTVKYSTDTALSSVGYIQHNLGKAPDFYFIFPASAVVAKENESGVIIKASVRLDYTMSSGLTRDCIKYEIAHGANGAVSLVTSGATSASSEFGTDTISVGSAECCFKANVTYRWIAGCFS